MNSARQTDVSTPLTPYIDKFITMKRTCGFSYVFEEYILAKFDDFCAMHALDDPAFGRNLVLAWAERRSTESEGYRSQRVSFVRQLAIFLRGQGIAAYVPHGFSGRSVSIPYIPNDDEITEFFRIVDSYPSSSGYEWMAGIYSVAFRLMYCCGMRIAECSNLEMRDVDLASSKLFVRKAKGHKDRFVFTPDGFDSLFCDYRSSVKAHLGLESEWAFPGRSGIGHIAKTTFDLKFGQFWSKVPGAQSHSKHPTPHALRHAFVVKRMNEWVNEGLDLEAMMPYLSTYLGHKGPSETFYYYHQVSEAFRIVRERDAVAPRIIPEVISYEA